MTQAPALEQTVLAHVHGELDHLAVHQQVSPAELNRLLRDFGLRAGAGIGPVRYAGVCRMQRYNGVHLVLQGEKGPVSVLVMPGEPVGGRTTLRDRRFQGILVPSGDGSIAIVGEQGEPVEDVERRYREAVQSVS